MGCNWEIYSQRQVLNLLNLRTDLKELALKVSTDPDHRFDLAVQLNDLDMALDIVRDSPQAGSEAKWKSVGDKALAAWKMDLAQECFTNAGDLPSLLLICTSLNDRDGMEKLAKLAASKGQNNIAFTCFLQLGDTASCISILTSTDRAPEAALFARTYAPSSVPAAVKSWKKSLEADGKSKLAESLADPETDGDRFEEGWAQALEKEKNGGVLVNGHSEANAASSAEEHAEEKGVVAELVDKVKDLAVGNGKDEGECVVCVRENLPF